MAIRYINEAALDRMKPQELLDAYIENAAVDDPAYVERISSFVRDLVHKSSYRRETTDIEDFEEDCVLAIWSKIRSIKTEESSTRIDNIEGFIRRSVYNRYCDAIRRKRPKWYNLKIEILEILTGKTGVDGFGVWIDTDSGERICGFAEWEGMAQQSSSKCKDLLDRPEKFKKKALENREPAEFPVYELVAHILRYIKGPVDVDTMTNCVIELMQIKGVQTISIDGFADEDSQTGSGHDWLLSSEADVEKQITDTGWFAHVAEWFWEEFEQLSDSQRGAVLLGLDGDQVSALIGSVGIERVAKSINVSFENLIEMIDKLPLLDSEIAKIIGSTVRSVPSVRFKAWAKIRRKTQSSDLIDDY